MMIPSPPSVFVSFIVNSIYFVSFSSFAYVWHKLYHLNTSINNVFMYVVYLFLLFCSLASYFSLADGVSTTALLVCMFMFVDQKWPDREGGGMFLCESSLVFRTFFIL